ncbi:hypothetical protein L7F22_061887 [Adiantum nelumboides]|nr:hypothetical protein [Adiantum nelumboides]
MTHLMYQFPGGYFRAEYKQYYVNSFPSSFSNLVKERITSVGLQIDDQITLAQINAFIDEVTDLECARLHMKKEFKQVKGFNSSFYNKETKSKDFGCAAAEKKCSCKVKNRRNKYGKKYKVARRTRKLSKEERKKVRCYICQKEGHIASECPKHKKRFGNANLPEKYEYEVVYCNKFEKHDIPISEYMQYESEEDETSDSTSSESPTEAVSTFSDDTSSVMFNMVRKPYAFPKKAKVRAESSSSSPSTTSGSEESEPSWMKKRRPSTLNLSKKEQRDYRPLLLFSNMVEQAEEIAKTEEWRIMIHPSLRQNQGNLPSPVLQQNVSIDFAIPKTAAKPSPLVVEKQLEKERQDRYCAEEHQLKAIQAMFSALEQVNNKIEQLHKLVLNTQSQSAAIEAKVDQCHGELQYLIDKAAMSEITKEPVFEWKLQRPANTCQVIPFNEKEHVSYFSEVWIKLSKIPSFRVDALWDTGAALSYLNQELVPPQLRQKLRHGIPVSYANNSRGQINQTVQCQIALTNLKAQVTLYLHPHPNTDLTIGSDVISKLTPWAIQPTGLITFSFNSLPYTITTKPRGSFLVGGVMPKLPNPTKELQYQQWFDQAKAKWSSELQICEDQLAKQTSDNPLAFWEREEYWISLPGNPEPKGLKATHPGMSIEDANLCKIEIDQMLKDGLISPSNNPYACQAFYVNNHSEQKQGKKQLVINYKPINNWLEHKRFPLPLKDDLLRRIKDCQWIAPQYPQLAKDLLIFKALDRCKSFFWHERLTRAVQQIKLACSILPPLRIPTDKPRAVYSDASEEAWGGILCEIDNDEPIIYRWASGRFSDTETRNNTLPMDTGQAEDTKQKKSSGTSSTDSSTDNGEPRERIYLDSDTKPVGTNYVAETRTKKEAEAVGKKRGSRYTCSPRFEPSCLCFQGLNMALGHVGILTSAIVVTGLLSFLFGIVAENKKPASGIVTQQGDLTYCVYSADPYVPLGALSAIFLAATSVLGVTSIFFAYNKEAVPVGALARSKMLVTFSIISCILFFAAEGLILWASITENAYHNYRIHDTAKCPTAKTGLMGGAAFLALDTMLFWLVCQMLTMNARADYLELDEEDEKGTYGYAPDYAAAAAHPVTKA